MVFFLIMFDLILLFMDIIFFILSFVFVIIDIKFYTQAENKDLDFKIMPKYSKYSLLFAFLAFVLMVIISFMYG